MKTYFEIAYPRRLKDLKTSLDKIADQYFSCEEEDVGLVREFIETVSLFAKNTELHLVSKTQVDIKYVGMLMPEYILNFLGAETKAGIIFSAFYIKRTEENDNM